MEEIHLNPDLWTISELNLINKQLIDWDFDAVQGGGFYSWGMNRHYGYVEIKMYKSSNHQSKMIWNVPDHQLLEDLQVKLTFQKVFTFFIQHIWALKGDDDVSLIFEIIDIGYHPVDSSELGYQGAAVRAIIDCFDKEYRKHKRILRS